VGGLDREGKFGDIMLADILTSYAKVLGDLWVTGCMFLGGISAMSKPDRACGGKFAVPFVIRYVSRYV
jgi:EXS family